MTAAGGVAISDLRVDGGATANALLLQLVADQLQIPVTRPVIPETTALGAAYAAGLGAGVWSSAAEMTAAWRVDVTVGPTSTRAGERRRLRHLASSGRAQPRLGRSRRGRADHRLTFPIGSRPAKVGMLTGGGDCPGLNAVMRAVVRKGETRLRRRAGRVPRRVEGRARGRRTMPLDVEALRGTLPRGGTILGSSRTNPYKVDGGPEQVQRDAGRARRRRPRRHRRRGHPRRGQPAHRRRAGLGRRRAQDDRQRPQRHRAHLRLRHRRADLRRRHRPAAHHRREPRPGHGRRGDGPPRRPHRALGGHRRRGDDGPHPREALRHRGGVRGAPPPPREPQPVRLDRRRGRGRGAEATGDAGARRRASSTPSATCASAASATRWPRRSRSAPATRAGPSSSATCSGAARRPRSTGCCRPGSASPPSTRCTTAPSGRWWRCGPARSSGCRSAEATGELKLVDETLYDVAKVFFG